MKTVAKASQDSESGDDEAAYEQRIRERAYLMWEADGKITGNEVEYWERARAFVGMMDNAGAGQLPNPVEPGQDRPLTPPIVEEAEIQENLGEFPDRLSDQGERMATPVKAARRRR